MLTILSDANRERRLVLHRDHIDVEDLGNVEDEEEEEEEEMDDGGDAGVYVNWPGAYFDFDAAGGEEEMAEALDANADVYNGAGEYLFRRL